MRRSVSITNNNFNVLVVPGGEFQENIVKLLLKEGDKVYVADKSENCFCSKFDVTVKKCSADDNEGLLKICKTHNIDFCITDQAEISVFAANYINHKLNGKGNSENLVKTYRDKYEMTKLAKKNKIKFPLTLINSPGDLILKDFQKERHIVIKPVDSQSSKGLSFFTPNTKIRSIDLENSRKYSSDQRILIQEKIEGQEYTVEGFIDQRSI